MCHIKGNFLKGFRIADLRNVLESSIIKDAIQSTSHKSHESVTGGEERRKEGRGGGEKGEKRKEGREERREGGRKERKRKRVKGMEGGSEERGIEGKWNNNINRTLILKEHFHL